MKPRADIYISADVETDGPIPGPYSMLSFGLAVAGRFDGERFERSDPAAQTFYVEIKPISDVFQMEAMRVNQLDRDKLTEVGHEPPEAMEAARLWIRSVAGGDHPVLVAYPVAFDWSFLYWYFIRFGEDSPFGYSGCLDIRTLYQAKAHEVHDRSGKRFMPSRLRARGPHTHNALDDAIEQAELFANVMEYVLETPVHVSRNAG